jgi:hypothetical protein
VVVNFTPEERDRLIVKSTTAGFLGGLALDYLAVFNKIAPSGTLISSNPAWDMMFQYPVETVVITTTTPLIATTILALIAKSVDEPPSQVNHPPKKRK